jgi:hypothetical protein
LVPAGSPVFWIRINETEPIATVLEARKPANLHKRKAEDEKCVILTIIAAEIVVRNAVAVVAAALLPVAVFGRPVVGTAMLPLSPLFALLCTLLLRRTL